MGLFRRNDEPIYRQQGIGRFIEAQKRDYTTALSEVRAGRKESHWIWYIFPQIIGLGSSCYANLYGIRNREEAEEYLHHKLLGQRLREITNALLLVEERSAEDIFGELDAMKVKSSMTLFDLIEPNGIYADVLNRFFNGERCNRTIEFINGKSI